MAAVRRERLLDSDASVQAVVLAHVWHVFIYAGLGVFAVVAGLILWSVIAYRRRSGDGIQAAQFTRNAPLEVAWTIVPILIVSGLFAVTYAAETSVDAVSSSPDEIVQVVAFRWGWRFFYPRRHASVVGTSDAPPTFALPLDRTSEIRLTSSDVIHAFWIPAFLYKRDAIPGTVNRLDVHPTRSGTFPGKCAEFCGLQHAKMTFTVRVLAPAAYAAWLREHGARQ